MTISMLSDELFKNMNQEIKDVGLVGENGETLLAEDLCEIVEGYIGRGYSLSSDSELGNYVHGVPL